jgi:serine/tyrosine/threonine adenylyltransferase
VDTVILRRIPTSISFDNAFVRDLPGDDSAGSRPRQVHGAVYSRVEPTPVAAPRLLAYSPEVAALLGIETDAINSQDFADVFGGNALYEGMEPYSANYGGHQFGTWAGQLGDGRAITLGEVITGAGERWELQLKGAGMTPYSRRADGRAVLRSSIREFLCSEAMHHLGVPTTRALSLVSTGDEVLRDMFYDGRARLEPGAIVCRVAPSFIRFGNFELPASRGDHGLLNQLIDFTIRRDFPELGPAKAGHYDATRDGNVVSGFSRTDADANAASGFSRTPDNVASRFSRTSDDVRAEWFAQVCERTARTIAHWMRVGFVHGVMNTDNMSVLGLTIDYGPYGWIDDFDPDWTPNTTDAGGRRYRFGHQAQIAYWNLGQLANALASVFPSTDALYSGLERYVATFNAQSRIDVAGKLGLAECTDDDVTLMNDVQALLHEAEVDMTIFFRQLADVDVTAPSLEPLQGAFYDLAKVRAGEEALAAWLRRYAARVQRDGRDPQARRAAMHAVNPRFVLRNYLAQEAIDRAERGDASGIHELLDLLRHPYDEQPGKERFFARRPEWARDRPGCSMLSCSS